MQHHQQIEIDARQIDHVDRSSFKTFTSSIWQRGPYGAVQSFPTQSFQVSRSDLAKVRWRDRTADGDLADSQVDVAIRRFALTANNITYARLGGSIPGLGFGYWDFFPSETGWGQIPVWGLADIVASRHPALEEGTALFGFFPMATHLRLTVDGVRGATVFEHSAHRRSLPATYNQYLIAERGLALSPEAMDAYMVLRPSFSLSFCCATYLSEQRWFDSRRILISSASAKAAMGLAMLLAGEGLEVVGLTSAHRLGQVAARAVCDRVLAYEDVASLPNNVPTVFIDIANAPTVTRAVHEHLQPGLRISIAAGFTHGADLGDRLPGPARQVFMAPAHMQRLQAAWGTGVYWQRFTEAWHRFHGLVSRHAAFVHTTGPANVERAYRQVLQGEVPDDIAHVLSL
ncbi:MAG TPA: DUF2855 family protein [Reyranella sp.]|jgi:hypothetical protein